ncbi:hypothetical protein FAI40_01800 [Acetobacteraceae bacterium]|nr:hypothetical protein FAI40_01800 [Acetobacteraceae bacterium]
MERSKTTGYPIHPDVKKRMYIRNLSPILRILVQIFSMAAMIIIGTMCGAFILSFMQNPVDGIYAQIIEWTAFLCLCWLMNFFMSVYCAARNRFK